MKLSILFNAGVQIQIYSLVLTVILYWPVAVEVDLVANDIVVDTKTTDDNGECEFEFTSTSNLYHVKTVYNGNLTYYDNSSDENIKPFIPL